MLPLIVKDSAVSDIQKAYDYLENREKDLGEKLMRCIEDYLSVIEINPAVFKEGYRKVRQVRVKPFNYLLRKVYKDYVAVIQLFHTKQHPKKKISR